MKLYTVTDNNYITEEYGFNNVVHISTSLEYTTLFVREHFDIELELQEGQISVQYTYEEFDEEYGERFIEIRVQEITE